MPVSGVVIRCNPELTDTVVQTLSMSNSVEISRVLDDATLIAVIDTPTVDDEVAVVKGLMETDGVFDVMVAYHNFEELME